MKSLTLVICLFASPAFAFTALRAVDGLKYPNDPSEGKEPIRTQAVTYSGDVSQYPGFSELLEYVVRSPHQEEGGTCLYMSLTGAAEFLMAQRNPALSRAPEGPLDLSERYFINTAGAPENEGFLTNWKTDSIEILNKLGYLPTNAGYRFTKGWAAKNMSGEYVHAQPADAGAFYDARFNWLDQRHLADLSTLTPLPRFAREVLFADPSGDQWNTAVMPPDIVSRIKAALHSRRAPVHVIYNHYGYWHAVDILGYDDETDSRDCNFTRKFIVHMEAKGLELRKRAAEAVEPGERQKLIRQAEKAERIFRRTANAINDGGCAGKGMFYVRDSIYTDHGGPVYDYDLTQTGDEYPYSRPIVLHEYEWVKYMANHATQIYLQ
jgi:hypothetical protein